MSDTNSNSRHSVLERLWVTDHVGNVFEVEIFVPC